MNNIPTAEELLDKKYSDFEALDSGNIWVNIEELMIEFAKHILEEASENAKTFGITASNGVTYWSNVDKQSITEVLNKYL